MSQTQDIPLYHASNTSGYRLIELPFEVESLLQSQNPPVLTLEQSSTSAILKTHQKSYALRQKNTSNALILIAPHSPPSTDTSQGVATVATLHETVELEPLHDPPVGGKVNHTGSMGKWHERFGRGR